MTDTLPPLYVSSFQFLHLLLFMIIFCFTTLFILLTSEPCCFSSPLFFSSSSFFFYSSIYSYLSSPLAFPLSSFSSLLPSFSSPTSSLSPPSLVSRSLIPLVLLSLALLVFLLPSMFPCFSSPCSPCPTPSFFIRLHFWHEPVLCSKHSFSSAFRVTVLAKLIQEMELHREIRWNKPMACAQLQDDAMHRRNSRQRFWIAQSQRCTYFYSYTSFRIT